MADLSPSELRLRLKSRPNFIRSLSTIKGTPMVPLHVDTLAKIAEEIDQAADTIELLEARVKALEGAVSAFLAKYAECEPSLTSAFVFQQMHLGPYNGPNFGEELAALRNLTKEGS